MCGCKEEAGFDAGEEESVMPQSFVIVYSTWGGSTLVMATDQIRAGMAALAPTPGRSRPVHQLLSQLVRTTEDRLGQQQSGPTTLTRLTLREEYAALFVRCCDSA